MKSIFDAQTREEIVSRINALNKNSTALWGKMTIYQMIKHCRLWEEMVLGKRPSKQLFIGRIFGKMALKSMTRDDTPIRHNSPTIPALKIPDTEGDIVTEKQQWISCIQEYANFNNPGFIHPFFGKMTKEQIGTFAYKHTDHHLRQFNC